MKIAIIGQQDFGKAVLEAFLARGDQVAGVFVAPDKEGARPDPLKVAAQEKGLPVLQFPSYRKVDAQQALRELDVELGVMAYVLLFAPQEFVNIPKHGTIQFHPSLLPRHRGPSSINWPIIQGETRTGLSIFWPDSGLDTGPILLQKEVAIEPDDTLGTVYFDKLFPLGVQAMLESVDLVKAGAAPRTTQDETQATYEGWCRSEDVQIDWSKPAATIHNLIRGADPAPGAWTTFKGEPLQLFASRKLAASASAAAGTVIRIADDGVAIAAAGGEILVRRVKHGAGKKVAAAELVASSGLAPGTRLG